MTPIGGNPAILTAIVGVLLVAGMVGDRLGVPVSANTRLILALALLSVAFAGLATRTMRVSEFRAAGHRQPLLRNALMAGGLALGLAGVGPEAGAAGALSLVLAAIAGLGLHAAVAGPVARSGAAGFLELVHLRFRSRLVTLLAGLAAIVPLGFVATAAARRAVTLLAEAMHLEAATAAGVVLGGALLMLLPGGAMGLAGVGVIFGAMALMAWGAPLAAILAAPDGAGALALADTTATFLAAGSGWGGIAGYACVAAGLIALCGTAAAAGTGRIARRASVLAAVLLALAGFAAAMVQSGVALGTAALAGRAPADLPSFVYSEQARGLITVCGIEPTRLDAVQRACERQTGGGEARIEVARRRDGRWPAVVLGLPVALGAVHALAPPLVLIFAFASLLHALAMLLSQDLVYRIGDFSGTASGRLAFSRLLLAGLGAAAVHAPALPAVLLAPGWRLALFLAAAVPVPLLLLALGRRVDWRAALCALLGVGALGAAILTGYLPDGPALLASGLAALATGWLAAAAFPSTNPADAAAADVLAGRAPGPLQRDRSA